MKALVKHVCGVSIAFGARFLVSTRHG